MSSNYDTNRKKQVKNGKLKKKNSYIQQRTTRRSKKKCFLFHLLPDDLLIELLTYFIWKDTSALALTNRFWSIRIRNAKKVFPEWKTTSFTVSNAANLLQLLESNYLGYANTRYSPQYLILNISRDIENDATRKLNWRLFWNKIMIALLHDQNIPRIGCGIVCTQTHKRRRNTVSTSYEWDIAIAVAQFPDTQIDYMLYDRKDLRYESHLPISSYLSVASKKLLSEQTDNCSTPSFQLFSTNTNAANNVLQLITQWQIKENINQAPNVIGSILKGSEYERLLIAALKPKSLKDITQESMRKNIGFIGKDDIIFRNTILICFQGAIKMHTFATTAGGMQVVSQVVPFAFEEGIDDMEEEEDYQSSFFNLLNYRNISLNPEGAEWFNMDTLFHPNVVFPRIKFFTSNEMLHLENLRAELDMVACSRLIPNKYANVRDHTPIAINLNDNRLTLPDYRQLKDETTQQYGFFVRPVWSLHSIDSILTRQFDSMNTLTPYNYMLLGSMIWSNHEVDYEHTTKSCLHWNTSQNIGPSLFYCPSIMHSVNGIPSNIQDDIICGAVWYKSEE